MKLSKKQQLSLEEAFTEYEKGLEHLGGCLDGNCVIIRPKGMHTNGGCRCSEDRDKARRVMALASYFKYKFKKILEESKDE